MNRKDLQGAPGGPCALRTWNPGIIEELAQVVGEGPGGSSVLGWRGACVPRGLWPLGLGVPVRRRKVGGEGRGEAVTERSGEHVRVDIHSF